MGDRLRAGKPSWYVTSHPGKLSLTISLWVGTASTSLDWEGNWKSGHVSETRGLPYPTTGSTAMSGR